MITNFDIKMPWIFVIFSKSNTSMNNIVFINRQGFFKIEDNLFPMSGLIIRTGGENNGVAFNEGEIYIEPGSESVDSVFASDFERVGIAEL